MTPVEEAKAEFLQVHEALLRSLETTPDDRLHWAPSSTARTIAQQVAHCAHAIGMIEAQIRGEAFRHRTTDEADRAFRDWEQSFSTREELAALVKAQCDSYTSYLDSLSEAELEGFWVLPFGLGLAPRSATLSVPALHTRSHIAQIDYIQTIYGDRDCLKEP